MLDHLWKHAKIYTILHKFRTQFFFLMVFKLGLHLNVLELIRFG
jgi:hypothetical protein